MRATVLRRIGLHLTIAICLSSTFALLPALAQSKHFNRGEFPGRRIGGGTRGECLMGSQPLVALNPVNNLGVTASDRPSLYFIVPPLDGSYPVEFILRDQDEKPVYETSLEAGKTKGIVGVHLPKQMLKAGQDYHWYFSVVCDPEDRSQNIVLSGWLRQVSPQLTAKRQVGLEAGLALAQSYQQTGLWSDAIATLVELRQTYPSDEKVLLQWKRLLQRLELQSVIEPSVASQF